jgi:hypothetical protein
MTDHRPPPAGRPLEALEDDLRRLPLPPVPAGLKERLLAAIPERSPPRRGWRRAWAAGALAAAGVLLALLLRWGKPPPAPAPKGGGVARPGRTDGAPPSRAPTRLAGGTEPGAPFRWPLPPPGMVALSGRLPDDLLE